MSPVLRADNPKVSGQRDNPCCQVGQVVVRTPAHCPTRYRFSTSDLCPLHLNSPDKLLYLVLLTASDRLFHHHAGPVPTKMSLPWWVENPRASVPRENSGSDFRVGSKEGHGRKGAGPGPSPDRLRRKPEIRVRSRSRTRFPENSLPVNREVRTRRKIPFPSLVWDTSPGNSRSNLVRGTVFRNFPSHFDPGTTSLPRPLDFSEQVKN
jgi:hypothetical protein